jgi:beta-lactamase class A
MARKGRFDTRTAFAVLLLAPFIGACSSTSTTESAPSTTREALSAADVSVGDRFRLLEDQHGARLGLFAVDTTTGKSVAYRQDERFPMASTFKGLAEPELNTATPGDERDTHGDRG